MSDFVPVLDVHAATQAACPTNGKAGKPVDTQILKAMLSLPLNVLRNVEYRFCPDPACLTVYYSADGRQVFGEADLRERVYQKHPQDADVCVCYCFRHTVREVMADGKRVVSEINQGIRNGQCACDIRNPQGSCCLGNVNAIVKQSHNIDL
jgi:hypothetical protein